MGVIKKWIRLTDEERNRELNRVEAFQDGERARDRERDVFLKPNAQFI